MNNPSNDRLELLQASLARLSERMPDAPAAAIMLSRVIVDLGRRLSALLEHQIRPYGLAEPEFRVLSVLFSQAGGAAHPGELCERTGQSPANMSRLSDALVSRGLITRVLSSKDRRRLVLRITEGGEELVRRLLPTMFEPLRLIFEDLPDAEQRALVAQLKRVGARLPLRPGEAAATAVADPAP
jgi:MarR family transcriptional repressor of emrRAB